MPVIYKNGKFYGKSSSEEGQGGHIIVNSADEEMEQRPVLKFGGDFDVSDNETDEQTEILPHELTAEDMAEIMSELPGPSREYVGHYIEDDSGTVMENRDNLQFGDGLETTDDPLGDRTVVSPRLLSGSDMEDILNPLPPIKFADKRNVYSTDEQIVGTWIDGKPIYQKTFTLLNYSDSDTTRRHHITVANIADLNIDMVVNEIGYAKLYNNNNDIIWVLPITSADYAPNENTFETRFINIGLSPSSNKLLNITCYGMNNWSTTATVDFYITLQYTKTTD